jgi:hypothetical protein
MTDKMIKYFGKDFTKDQRIQSYNFIENYISDKVQQWETAPETDKIAADFANILSKMDNMDFSFLLCHSGYIPEFYEHDSSQETLYSKLIEVLICEWAKRVGFKDSAIQKQKASKEDITIQLDNIVIVCDAKSYRLGRSQAAPNVKDTIKKADYEKWQDWWADTEPHVTYGKLTSIGGLITFPSLHRWKGSSDAYLYASDKEKPIIILFYEHLAFYLIKKYNQNGLIGIFRDYNEIFPAPSKDQTKYFTSLLRFLFSENWTDFEEYMGIFAFIIKEKVLNTIERISEYLSTSKERIIAEIEAIPVEKLKGYLIESRFENECGQIIKQLENIKKFRPC